MMHTGRNRDYWWVRWTDERPEFPEALLEQFPEIVIGRYLVNTSYDSGRLQDFPISTALRQSGWRFEDRLAYSPRITRWDEVPNEQPYVEWYAFDEPPGTLIIPAFVNWGGFDLAENTQYPNGRFWDHVHALRPAAFWLESGHILGFGTPDEALHTRIANHYGKMTIEQRL